jgi:hypothetical protein
MEIRARFQLRFNLRILNLACGMVMSENRFCLKILERRLRAANRESSELLRGMEILHVLRFFEWFRVFDIPELMRRASGGESYAIMLDRGRQNLNTCMHWFYLAAENQRQQAERTRTTVIEMNKMAQVASTIWHFENCRDAMNTLWNGLLSYSVEESGIISIDYPDELSKRFELGEWLKERFQTDRQFAFSNWERLLKSCKGTLAAGLTFEYEIDEVQFKELREYVREWYLPYQKFPADWDFGGYQVGDLREVWIGLLSFSFLHGSLLEYSAQQHPIGLRLAFPLQSSVPIDSRSNWVSKLAQWTDLDPCLIDKIMADLIHCPGLYHSSGKKPEASAQPFFELDSGNLALSCFLVGCTDYEKSMWDLLNVLRSGTFGTLSGLKEKVWRGEMAQRARNIGLVAHPNLKFKRPQEGDVDILLLDPVNFYGLACELKWLAGPDRIKDVELRHLTKAFTQAEKNKAWISGQPTELAEKINMKVDDLMQFEIEHLIICRNSTVNGVLRHSSIPMVYEGVFDWLVFQKGSSLKTAFENIKNYGYLPSIGVDFEEERTLVEHGGVRFRLSNFKPLRHWEPQI